MIPRRFFWLVDAFCVGFAFMVTYALWRDFHAVLRALPLSWLPAVLQPAPLSGDLPPFGSMFWVLLLAVTAAIIVLEMGEAYQPLMRQTRARILVCAAAAPLASTGIITLVAFFQRSAEWSRSLLLLFIVLCTITLATVRMSLRHYFQTRLAAGFYTKNVLLVGPAEIAAWLANYFAETVPPTEYRVLGYVRVPSDRSVGDSALRLLGNVDQLGDMLIKQPIDEVVAVQPNDGGEWMPSVIENCDSLGILLRIVPQGLLFGKVRVLRTLYPLQLLHLPAVVLAPPHFDSDAVFFKRAFDIVMSAVLLTLLSPLFLLIAIAIKISDPKATVFYRWNVVGRNGVRFTGYKFTTMYADADHRRDELLQLNEMKGPVFKIKNDPRVTPLGRFLRKYSLNELPQLWSVLRGDMSLVGPRPAFPHELEAYGFWHKRKLSVRPGITCLWQVRGRNRISDFDDWVRMDLEYIDNWSLWLDVKILARTAWAVVAGTGS